MNIKNICLIILIGIVLININLYGQEKSYSGNTPTTKGITNNKVLLLKWWDNFSECNSKKILDTANFETQSELSFAGQIPVQYHMYGGTSEGGVVKFKLRIVVTSDLIEYKFYDVIHFSTPGVKHKDGGPLLEDKSQKGSMIFPKTWKSYQEQMMSFIHSTEVEIIKVTK